MIHEAYYNFFFQIVIFLLLFCTYNNEARSDKNAYMSLQESRLKFKSWLSYTWPEAVSSIEISYKKVRDGYPLRLWKATTEIDAEPDAVMKRIVHERYL